MNSSSSSFRAPTLLNISSVVGVCPWRVPVLMPFTRRESAVSSASDASATQRSSAASTAYSKLSGGAAAPLSVAAAIMLTPPPGASDGVPAPAPTSPPRSSAPLLCASCAPGAAGAAKTAAASSACSMSRKCLMSPSAPSANRTSARAPVTTARSCRSETIMQPSRVTSVGCVEFSKSMACRSRCDALLCVCVRGAARAAPPAARAPARAMFSTSIGENSDSVAAKRSRAPRASTTGVTSYAKRILGPPRRRTRFGAAAAGAAAAASTTTACMRPRAGVESEGRARSRSRGKWRGSRAAPFEVALRGQLEAPQKWRAHAGAWREPGQDRARCPVRCSARERSGEELRCSTRRHHGVHQYGTAPTRALPGCPQKKCVQQRRKLNKITNNASAARSHSRRARQRSPRRARARPRAAAWRRRARGVAAATAGRAPRRRRARP